MADANRDGKITREEWTAHHNAMFEHMDANKDGTISKDEIKGKMTDGKCGSGK
jgi:Ca2+-binding EF-hand superfamily protein